MAVADLSFFVYFLPIISFLVVFMVSYAVLTKAKIFDVAPFWNIFLSFLVAVVFVISPGPRTFVESIIPWFAILLISFFLILVLFGLSGFTGWNQTAAKVFGIALLVLFVVSGVIIFSSYFSPYLPWNSGAGANPDVRTIVDWTFSPRVFGAILLIGVSALVSYFLVGFGKKK